MGEFSHVNGEGASMVDVSEKPDVRREATASGRIDLEPSTVTAIREGATVKEDVLATARVAAIQAVKRTWDEIPMCHQIPISDVTVHFDVEDDHVRATVSVVSIGQTGTEMEALNGVTRGLLTVWDMVKSAEKDEDGTYSGTEIRDVRVLTKKKTPIE